MPLTATDLQNGLIDAFTQGQLFTSVDPEISYEVIGFLMAAAYHDYVTAQPNVASDGSNFITALTVNLPALQDALAEALTPIIVDDIPQGKDEDEAADLWAQGLSLYWLGFTGTGALFGPTSTVEPGSIALAALTLSGRDAASIGAGQPGPDSLQDAFNQKLATIPIAAGNIAEKIHTFTTSLTTTAPGTVI